MANINDAFPSKYLSASDLGGRSATVTIANARIETIGKGTDAGPKIVLQFVGKQKFFVCNKTNAKTIASLHGEDTDGWLGKSITIAPREVEFQGNMVWSIRVSLQRPVEAEPVQGVLKVAKAARAPAAAVPVAPDDTDDIPF
jgi:hypothetical protein